MLPRRLIPGLLLLFVWPVHAAWEYQVRPVPEANLRAVHAVSPRVVWVVGSAGTCLRTVNSGRTWERSVVSGAEGLDFRGVVAFSAQAAVLLSAGESERGRARLYRTEDGGRSWQQVFETKEPGVFLNGLAFWDERNGMAFGDPVDGFWYLLRTRDGGRTWTRLKPAVTLKLPVGEAAFAASNSALAVQGDAMAWVSSGGADRARVYRSADRGETWTVADTPLVAGPTAGLFGLYFWNARNGVAVGGDYKQDAQRMDNVVVTDDGGKTWRLGAPAEPAGLKEAVIRLPSGVLLAVGPTGTSLSRDAGQSWTLIDGTSLHAVSGAGEQVWAVGERGLITRWK